MAVLVFWSALTPPSWFGGGPLYLGTMLVARANEFHTQTVNQAFQSDVLGAVPTRYLWPIELMLLILAAYLIPRVLKAR